MAALPDKRIKDLSGRKFHRWEVIDYAGCYKPDKGWRKYHLWTCRCDCGHVRDVSGANLSKGLSKSCGCASIKNLIGQVFKNLTVVSFAETRKSNAFWNCLCKCGNSRVCSGRSLTRGDTTSCGCLRGKHCITHGLTNKPKEYRDFQKKDPFKRLRSRFSIAIGKALKRRKSSKGNCSSWIYLPYTPQDLKNHLESLWEPWMNWDNYGGRADNYTRTWWIDHIVPQHEFRYTSMDSEEFLKCWDLSNLRPLEKMENIRKGSKIGCK